MPDNVLQTLQQLVQDVIAPDVRELKVRLAGVDNRIEGLDKRIDRFEKQMDVRFDALEQKNEAQFKAIMAAIAESKAQAELSTMRLIASLSERVAVLEAQRH